MSRQTLLKCSKKISMILSEGRGSVEGNDELRHD